MQNPPLSPTSICVLRLSAIGDVCHAVAAVQAIQRRWPQAKITWVIGKIEHQLLQGLPGVEFVLFDKKAGLKGYIDLKRALEGQNFDQLLHMQVAFRASLATLCIKARQVWGFDKGRAKEGQWLFTNHRIAPQLDPHVADGFMGFARALGVPADQPLSWTMPLSQADLDWQQSQLASIGAYLVLAPAASKAERNWSPEGYAKLAEHAKNRGFSVVICGAPTSMEKQLAADIIALCPFKPVNLVGKTSLKQLLAVLQKASLVIAPDTGPAHMAVTVNTPVIGLYMHSNPKRTGPYYYQDYVVSHYEQEALRQYGKSLTELPWGKRCKGENLMQQIQVDEVITSFNRLVKNFGLLAAKDSR